MKKAIFTFVLISLIVPFGAFSAIEEAAKNQPAEATIYRDDFGIPHVFAPTLEAAAFAIGYAQAEDRLEELLKNYRRANGTMSEVFGPNHWMDDITQRTFRHAEVARERYNQVSPHLRAAFEAFQEGVKLFMKEHPEQVPKWAQEIHPWDIVALSRYIIYGWPVGEAVGDLRRANVQLALPGYRGSNQMLIAPRRTAMNAPIAVIDPHLSWYGQFRFYQVRIYAGDFNVSGVSILGVPIPSLGHSRFASVAMTTGGPDTSDIYEEEINPNNPRQYKYDGNWRDMTVRKEKIGVKTGDKIEWREIELEYTHHGPIVSRKDGKAYAVAIPYATEVGLSDQVYEMMTARNLEEMKKALSHLQLMAQNVMVATVQGDIFYVRNGRVPVRAKGVDPTRPVPGNTSATEWQGIHTLSDLVQITNPPSGYMHNNNVTPFAMMKDGTPEPEKYLPYIYNATRTAPRHQRGEMMTELLDKAGKVTAEQAIDIAFSPQVYKAELWQERLRDAHGKTKKAFGDETEKVYELIQKWNRRSDADSEGAIAYYAFKKSLDPKIARTVEPPADLSNDAVIEALTKATEWLKSNLGSVTATYGQYFRVGRRGGTRTFPVGGGSVSDAAMATPRAISFEKVGNVMVGHGGQTSTQIVIMTNPPKSYAVIPLGQSDHPGSRHWDDQAEKLFSRSKAAPSYFMDRNELMKYVAAKKTLKYQAAAQAAR